MTDYFSFISSHILSVIPKDDVITDSYSTDVCDRFHIAFIYKIIPQVVFDELFAIRPYLIEHGIHFYVTTDHIDYREWATLKFYRYK